MRLANHCFFVFIYIFDTKLLELGLYFLHTTQTVTLSWTRRLVLRCLTALSLVILKSQLHRSCHALFEAWSTSA